MVIGMCMATAGGLIGGFCSNGVAMERYERKGKGPYK